jgi:hypothetical protein
MMGVVQSPRTAARSVIGAARSEHLVNDQTSRPPDTPEAIQSDLPGWRIWRSRTGSMWGASLIDGTKGVDLTVIEDSPEQLRAQLAIQAEAAGRRP